MTFTPNRRSGVEAIINDMELTEIALEHIFDYVEVNSEYLRRMLKKVLLKISNHININELDFGPVIEGHTFCKEAGEVTDDGMIILDSEKLKKYDDNISMAITAHELAHFYLKHHLATPIGLEFEYEADELAQKWGFAIDKFRAVCGYPTLNMGA